MYFLNYTRIFRLWQLNSDWGHSSCQTGIPEYGAYPHHYKNRVSQSLNHKIILTYYNSRRVMK